MDRLKHKQPPSTKYLFQRIFLNFSLSALTVLIELIQLGLVSLSLHIESGSREPIYRQIMGQIKWAVARGSMKAGDELPSVRMLAQQLVVNPNTVSRAYSDLQSEGLIESVRGKGYFIAPTRDILSDVEKKRLLNLAQEQFVREVLMLGYSRKEILKQLDTYWKQQLNTSSKHGKR